MTARVTLEMSVGLTPEIQRALQIATEFSGMKASQYGRQAILERLVREGYLRHPRIANFENTQAAE
jgi:hypothetical protein